MKTLTDKIEAVESATNYTRTSHGFVSADGDTLIDTIHHATGRSVCYGKTLGDFQTEYPGATIQSVADYCRNKGTRQDAEPLTWQEVTEEKFYEMLEALPPAARVGSAFLVGEASDHHAATGRPRFSAFKAVNGVERTPEAIKFFASSRPMTHKEFCAMFGECQYCYND